ncbi:phosphate ABC transporter substrate-binding protein [Butyricicoccus pullicaecorum]|nr:phosphate ABC transporter substrate-binding protein [Butyricicoccus pullicaecorum]
MNPKKLTSLFLAGVLTLSLAACGGASSNNDSAASANDGAADAAQAESMSGKVTLGGSTSVEKVIGALSESFMQEYPDVDVTYDPTGSGAGITGAQEGTLDIGLSSRALKDDETGLTATTFALDGIAIVVNPENAVSDLSLEQIKGLADGTITNWSEVGGADAPVVLIGREAGSGTRDGFESIVGVKDACEYESELTSTGAVIAAVASNPNAFGYASLSAVDETVKPVTVEGVAASEATVQDGSYKIQRPFVFVTKEGAALSEAAQAFMDYATNAQVNELIQGAGAVPVA